MNRFCVLFVFACTGMCFAESPGDAQVTLGTWLSEGTGDVTGVGDTFTATPLPSGIADDGDNFDERNEARQRVYQTFDDIAFSAAGDFVQVDFDLTISGNIDQLDTGFRFSLLDTSTNQGFYPISFDTGGRSGTYNRARFVDNLDGVTGDAHGGAFTDAINASGTIASAAADPTITNDATENGLIDGNTLSFSALLVRNADDSFSFTANATEANGDVVYAETAGSYDPVNPSSPGDTTVANLAVNSFDGIAFGLFNDDPFSNDAGGSYTVSNISINAVPEPGSAGLLLIAGLGFATRRRRNRQ